MCYLLSRCRTPALVVIHLDLRISRFGPRKPSNLRILSGLILTLNGSASLSVLFGLIGRLADKREHAKEHGLGSWAGRADCWGRAGWRLLGDLGRGTGSRLLWRMPRAVDASAQP